MNSHTFSNTFFNVLFFFCYLCCKLCCLHMVTTECADCQLHCYKGHHTCLLNWQNWNRKQWNHLFLKFSQESLIFLNCCSISLSVTWKPLSSVLIYHWNDSENQHDWTLINTIPRPGNWNLYKKLKRNEHKIYISSSSHFWCLLLFAGLIAPGINQG